MCVWVIDDSLDYVVAYRPTTFYLEDTRSLILVTDDYDQGTIATTVPKKHEKANMKAKKVKSLIAFSSKSIIVLLPSIVRDG